MDWHGPSAQEAWGTVDALQRILARREQWHSWGIAPNTKVLLMGHSNGGQGTWYALTHRPDRVLAAAAVSGYLSIEQYVPYHFWSPVQPAVAALLSAARSSYRRYS